MGSYTPQTPCAPRAAKHPLRVCSAPRSLKYPRRKEVPPIDFCHFPVSIIKRSEGRSAVAAAAYRSGTKLTNEWDGLTHDYTRKGGVVHEPDIGRITNNAKVTDHHAIIPTVQLEKQDLAELPESEQKIIRLIAMRLLSATGEKHIYDETSVTLTCEGFEFKAKGKTVVQDGWKSVERCFKETLKSKEKDEPERSLPSLNEKDILFSVDSSVTEHYTSPPKSYTDVIFCERKEWIGIEERSSA